MTNIIIIPPENTEKTELIKSLSDKIKEKLPVCSISIIVNVNNYYNYYDCKNIDGYIIEPAGLLKKIFLFEAGHFNILINGRKELRWKLASYTGKIPVKLSLEDSLTNETTFLDNLYKKTN
jgi:hypothetical protein